MDFIMGDSLSGAISAQHERIPILGYVERGKYGEEKSFLRLLSQSRHSPTPDKRKNAFRPQISPCF
jgi:hypothetical protein